MAEPYESHNADLILRDHLAIDRTALANERTLLAYIRTALALLITGASAIKFFTSPFLHVSGLIFIALSILTFLIGALRYRRMARRMRATQMPRPPG